jgi:sucrose-6-phosphate hydrolase SacC (GH32 family)
MALYLSGSTYGLFTSDNLTDWRELQRIVMPEENECPDLFPLTASDGARLWILIGAHDRYLVGRFSEGRFSPVQPIRSLHCGNSAYAGQTFSGMPDGRVVRIDWDRWNVPPERFCGQMSIPAELSLVKRDDGYALAAAPVRELDTLVSARTDAGPLRLAADTDVSFPLADGACRIRMRGPRPTTGTLTMTVFGRPIVFDLAAGRIRVSRCEAPLGDGAAWDAAVVIDRSSVEIYADGGTVYLTALDEGTVMDRTQPILRLRSDTERLLDEFVIDTFRSVWEEE